MNERYTYHRPVMVDEVCKALITDRNGAYLDGTLGGAGHAEAVLLQLSREAIYIGIDRDPDALAYARRRLQGFENIYFYHGTFVEMEAAMEEAGVSELDGILFDLGISGHQVDVDGRGFTFRADAPLDMRMNPQERVPTAADILQQYDYADLVRIFREYGEERQAVCIARRIVRQRRVQPIQTSGDLVAVIDACVRGAFKKKSYARIFQALRIEVNRELELLSRALEIAPQHLKKGGRLVVISYHSLEDRIVKRFMQEWENPCVCPPQLPECRCGRKPLLRRVKPYLKRPSPRELEENPRARSAKMRVGEKL